MDASFGPKKEEINNVGPCLQHQQPSQPPSAPECSHAQARHGLNTTIVKLEQAVEGGDYLGPAVTQNTSEDGPEEMSGSSSCAVDSSIRPSHTAVFSENHSFYTNSHHLLQSTNYNGEFSQLSQDSLDFRRIITESEDTLAEDGKPIKQESDSTQPMPQNRTIPCVRSTNNQADAPTTTQELASTLGVSEISFAEEVEDWMEELHQQRIGNRQEEMSLSQSDYSATMFTESPTKMLCNEVLQGNSNNSSDAINLGAIFDGTATSPIKFSRLPQLSSTSPTVPLTKAPIVTEANPQKRPASEVANASTSKTPSKRRNGRSQSSSPAHKSRSRKRMDNALHERWKSQVALREALRALENAKSLVKECRTRYSSAKTIVQTTAKEENVSLLQEDTPWNEMFHLLKKYKEETGDCNVKQKFGGEGKDNSKLSPELVRLSLWVGKNRKDGKARGRGAGVCSTMPKPQGKSCDDHADSESDENSPSNYGSEVNHSSAMNTNFPTQNKEYDDSSVFEDIDPESIHADPYKEIALDNLGFDWDPRNSRWNSMYEELKSFKENHGTTLVPHANFGLGSWVKRQQVQYSVYSKGDGTKSELTEDRVRLLNELGFVWSRRTNTWNENFQRLVKWKEKHGTCYIPDDSDDPEMITLHKWVTDQRVHYKRHIAEKEAGSSDANNSAKKNSKRKLPTLTPEKIGKLQSIGFEFDARDAKWLQKLEVLLNYKQRYGDFLVPSNYPEDPTLSNWVASQRAQYNLYKKGNKSHMTERRLKILNDVGFSFSVNEERQKVKEEAAQLDRVMFDAKPWEDKYKNLLFYIALHGGLENIQKNDPFLAEWTAKQRKEYQQPESTTDSEEDDENEINNEINNDLKQRFELMTAAEVFSSSRSSKEKVQPQIVKSAECLCPNKDEIAWERQYGAIAAWYIKYGTYASKGMPTKMRKFMSKQQEQYRHFSEGMESELTAEQVEKLEEIFFPFNKASSKEVPEDDVAASRRNRSWEEYRADLAISYIQKGNYDSQALDDLELRRWATEQKRQHKLYLSGKQAMLTYVQIQKLIEIKFISKRPKHRSWAENCADLMAFRIQHGNFDVASAIIKPSKGRGTKDCANAATLKSLQEWVTKLRVAFNESPDALVANEELTQEQLTKLKSVGFPWIESGDKPLLHPMNENENVGLHGQNEVSEVPITVPVVNITY